MHNLNSQLNKIKLVILDVDGVLTSGQIVYSNSGEELKFFNIKDGLAIKQLQEHGIAVAIITARESTIVTRRATELNIQYVYQNQKNKLDAYKNIKNELNLDDCQVAYMGDDWPDLPVLMQVGMPVVVNDAEELIKPYAKYITEKTGGNGAVREFAYLLLKAQNKLSLIINKYSESVTSKIS
jgi:3-deoxy-D-manno-octulosonate 8-phosphate phosphatase (KDO 8-P phosphatase)